MGIRGAGLAAFLREESTVAPFNMRHSSGPRAAHYGQSLTALSLQKEFRAFGIEVLALAEKFNGGLRWKTSR
jgi:hypothetical protein